MRYSFGAGGEGGGGDEDDGGEGGGTGDGVLVARAACAQPAGAELLGKEVVAGMDADMGGGEG